MLWNWRKILFLWTNPSNEVAISFAWRRFSSIQMQGDEGRLGRNKSLSLGRLPMDPPLKYSISYKRLSLGMPKASPSSSTIIGFSHGTIFLFLYTLCAVLGVSVCFYFQFVCVSFLVLAIIRIHACLFGRETRSAFSLYTRASLICVECLAFVIYAFSSCFQASLVQSC